MHLHVSVEYMYLLFCSIHSSKYDERQAVRDQREWRSAVVGDHVGVPRRIYQAPAHASTCRYYDNRRQRRLITHIASATHSRNEVA